LRVRQRIHTGCEGTNLRLEVGDVGLERCHHLPEVGGLLWLLWLLWLPVEVLDEGVADNGC
jgi:hypothetical protein